MGPQAKVRRVELVRIDHPEYVEEMSRQAVAHRRLGPRADPGDLYRASGIVEGAVRTWLGERLPLLDARVIEAEVLPAGERAYVRRFLELDAVIGTDDVPERVVEMKFSSSGGAVRRGLGQLARARDLLRQRWPGVTGLLILVEANRTGVELDVDRLREVDVIRPASLTRRDRHAPMTLLVLTVTDLAAHLDDAARALVERDHDEGDALTMARVARAARDRTGEIDDPQDMLRRPDADPGHPPSVIFDGG
ncbi:MAG TPA: hypothetical protein VMT36_03355, partial [Candidatus Saccharimonadia bacterium]|nr:hypothetical protein [Candidatus Saccharimonadia bacterium]